MGAVRQLVEGRDGWGELGLVERKAFRAGAPANAKAWKEEASQNSVANAEGVPGVNDECCLEWGGVGGWRVSYNLGNSDCRESLSLNSAFIP